MWGGMREWKRKRRMRGSEKGGGEKKRVGHMEKGRGKGGVRGNRLKTNFVFSLSF